MPHKDVNEEVFESLREAEARADEWSPPTPFSTTPQPCPPNLLPGALGNFVEALSAHTETPRELALSMCLAVVSASVAGGCEVEICEGYSEPLNLFIAAALESGNRKTAVVNAARQPLTDFESEQRERIAPQRRKALSQQEILEARIQDLRKKISRESDEAAVGKLQELEQSTVEIPEIPRLWTQDCTPEALAVLMSKHGERMAVLSDEGGYFDILAGRYSRGIPNLDVVLQAHAGAPVRVDRKSVEAIFLEKPLLTIGLSPQPSVLTGLADIPGFRGRGLLARFLYAVPASNLGYRNHEPRPIPSGVRRDYESLVRLLALSSGVLENGSAAVIRLNFSPAAYESWREFQRMGEIEMQEGNRLAGIKDWGGKLPGAAARMAGVFHCVATDPARNSQISRDTAELALVLASVLVSHATCAFGLIGSNVNVYLATRLVKWAVDRGLRKTTKRDIFCAFQSTFKTVDKLELILRLLVEHNYLRIEDRPTGGRGSQTCRWNPMLWGAPQ